MSEQRNHHHGMVAVVLAVGIVLALNVVTVAVLWDAIAGPHGLDNNETQVLTTAFGGIIGVLGSYIGFRAGQQHMETFIASQHHDDEVDG